MNAQWRYQSEYYGNDLLCSRRKQREKEIATHVRIQFYKLQCVSFAMVKMSF